MKYKKQGKQPTCGPYAIYNALIWAGQKETIKNLKRMVKFNGYGTMCFEISNALLDLEKKRKIKYHYLVIEPKLKHIDEAIDDGNAVILRYFCSHDHQGHYALCIGRDKKTYTIVNNSADRNVVDVYARKRVSMDIRRSRDLDTMIAFPCAWVIGKQ